MRTKQFDGLVRVQTDRKGRTIGLTDTLPSGRTRIYIFNAEQVRFYAIGWTDTYQQTLDEVRRYE